jgi:hypothetical protein
MYRWKNITLSPVSEKAKISHLYTKSFNERFHGTTFFRPGVYGYQQHLFTASLGEDAIVFVNHPGASSDSSSMRPGYWYGNGILPLVRQSDCLLAACYEIPDDYPVSFTHAYFRLHFLTRLKNAVTGILHERIMAILHSGAVENLSCMTMNWRLPN